eukprot:SAG22_NODE_6163_length_891_cov_1.226010_1_plen_44_part_10
MRVKGQPHEEAGEAVDSAASRCRQTLPEVLGSLMWCVLGGGGGG